MTPSVLGALCGVAAATAVLAAPCAASGAEPAPVTTPPAAVLASVQPGGAAFRAAVAADFTSPNGTVDTEAAKRLAPDVTFGPPHRLAEFVATHVHGGAPMGAGPTFTEADLGTAAWMSIEFRNGSPFGLVWTDSDGQGVSVGGGIFNEQLEPAIDALPTGAVVFYDDPHLQVFAISPDLTAVSPLNSEAVALVGSTPVDAPTFRDAMLRQAAADAKEQQSVDLPPDAVGGAPGSRSATAPPPSPAVGYSIVAGAAASAASAVVLVRRRRQPRRPLAGGRGV